MGEPLVYNQATFIGGFNRQYDSTRLQRDSYPLLVNARVRDDIVQTIMRPTRITGGLPEGKIQGLYAADKLSLVFVDGMAYYKDHSLINPSYVQIVGFQMSADVDVIYAELVPASSVNLARKASDANAANAGVNFVTSLTASPACVVCQDGINQPRLIFTNGTTAISKTWNEWTITDREYVPVGKQMLYSAAGILYVVAPDGKSIYRSVTGRPLDFIIAVDTTGNKVGTEAASGAAALSHTISFDEITAIHKTNSSDGAFIISTLKNTWLVYPDFTDTIYGEPTFTNQFLFDTGAMNQFSICELMGDTALIDTNSIRSFNAVLNSKNEGRNSPFSRKINAIFSEILQPTDVCAFPFDNYSLFSVQTIYGASVVLYDNINEAFVGFDQYHGIDQIKQFAEVKVGTLRRLLFITTDNKLYEAFTGTLRERAFIYIGDLVAGDPKVHQKIDKINTVFFDAKETGIVYASVFVDGKLQFTLSAVIKETIESDSVPIELPFGSADKDRVKSLTYDCTTAEAGWKIGVMFEWDFDAKLSNIRIEAVKQNQATDYEQQAVEFARYSAATKIEITSFTPESGGENLLVNVYGNGFTNVTAVKLDGVNCEYNFVNDNHIVFTVPSGATSGRIKLVSLYDEVESTTDFTVT